jgi:adenylate cyclase
MTVTVPRAPRPATEDQRLAALRRYEILDSKKEQLFDDLTKLAAEICDMPVSLITLVDKDRVWVKSTVGVDVNEMPRDGVGCSYAILDDKGIVVPDMTADARFPQHHEGAEAGLQFYAGTPLRTHDGHNLGTLCVLDSKPREMNETQLEKLRMLARQAMAQIELRHNLDQLATTTRKAMSLETLIRQYTSRSVWQRADVTVTNGGLELLDEEVHATYLFLDVVGFTSLAEKLGPSGTVSLLNEYFKLIVDIIFEHNGDVDKFVGDQLFCIFARSEDALAAALKIHRKLDELNVQRATDGEIRLDFTIGINAGKAIRANVGGTDRRDNTLIGNAVNVAARLQKVCRPGGILVSHAVYQSATGIANSVQTVRLKLKNVADSVVAHYIEAPTEIAAYG